MYISGTPLNFETRLHSLPTSTGDLVTGFCAEGESYIANFSGSNSQVIPVTGANFTGNLTYDLTVKWSREFALKNNDFTNSGVYPYSTVFQYFTTYYRITDNNSIRVTDNGSIRVIK